MSLGLLRFETIIEKLRSLDPEMQMQSAMCLSIIARCHEAGTDITVKEIGEKLGLSSASASRNVAVLSEWNRHDEAGKNLVKAIENPKRRVEKFVRLTDKGKRFIAELEHIVMGETKEIDILEMGESPNKQRHLDKMAARKEDNMRRMVLESYISGMKLSRDQKDTLLKAREHLKQISPKSMKDFFADLMSMEEFDEIIKKTGYKPELN